jgi:hypothetical protein
MLFAFMLLRQPIHLLHVFDVRNSSGTIVVVHNAKSRKLPRAVRHMILCGRHMRVSIVLVNSVIVDKNLRANIDVTVSMPWRSV